MAITHVIFDLDGTLLDTLGDLAAAVNFGLTHRGYPNCSRETVRSHVGNGVRNLIERSLPAGSDEVDACLVEFRAYYETHMTVHTKPYPGIPELVEALTRLGIELAVLSNKYDTAAKSLVEHYFPGRSIMTLGERPGIPRKPDSVGVLEILQTLRADPENTLYVGDSGEDMLTAKNSGLRAVGVTWGFRSREVLVKNGADVIIDHPAQLLNLL